MKSELDKIKNLNLILSTIRNVNQLLIKEKDRDNLLQGICNTLIENRGYYNAWIALLDGSGHLITEAEAGLGEAFSPMIKRFRDGDLTYCGRKALSHPHTFVIEDPVSTCVDCPLSVNYAGRSAMVVRLEYEGTIYGILSASVPKNRFADEEERNLFKEVAGDIAFALYDIELEEKHKQTDEALKESEQRFRNLVENSIMGISIYQEGQIIYQNPEQEILIGPLPRKYLFTDLDRIHPEDIEKVKKFYENIISEDIETLDIDFRFYSRKINKNRSDLKWVYCRAIAIEYQGKEAILVNTMDVTRLKELENLLRIQDKMTSLGRVAAGIAHEIRNPLSGINIYTNALKKMHERDCDDEKIKEILEQIQSASTKIETVIKRVMDFSKPSEPKFDIININKPIEEAINLSVVTLRKVGIQIEKDLSNNLPKCYADSQLIEQVFLNLIANAAEAMKDVNRIKTIQVRSLKDGGNITLKVADSGPGVPVHLQDKIFDPFYSTKNGSTGIGLSMSQRIIADHKGTLKVHRSQLGGAEFIVEIPIMKCKRLR